MKIYICSLYSLLLCLIISCTMHADSMISLYLKPYPLTSDDESVQKFNNELTNPNKLTKHQLRFRLEKIMPSGIFASYAGNVALSDLSGHIVFPLKHAKPMVYLLVTSRITPIVMFFNTLKHWILEKGTPAAFYKIEQKKDEQTNQIFWDVQEMPLPEDGIIPAETIILLAKPKHVYVPTGITLAQQSPHMLLPNIYIRKGVNNAANALYLLHLRHYFGSIIPMNKIDKDRYTHYGTR